MKREQQTKVRAAAKMICDVLEAVDNRCAAADGPVQPTKEQMTAGEFRQLYEAASTIRAELGKGAQ